MKTKTIILALLCISVWGYGQYISNVDFDSIRLNIQDSTSKYYYPNLNSRLLENDTTLTSEDYKHLYFGNVYSDNYSPYGKSEIEKEFINLYKAGYFKEAKVLGKKVLKENLINIQSTYRLLICYDVLGIRDTARIYANKYFSLLDVIYRSGDGKSISTAYVVISADDEYQILTDLGLKRKRQDLLSGPTDRLSIYKKGQKRVKGRKKIKELYFNVSKPFEYMKNQFRKEE